MWNKSDETAAPGAPLPTNPKPGAPLTANSKSGAMIGKSLRVEGSITGAADLIVDGEVEGEIRLEENNLIIGENGSVTAEVTAREVRVLGKLKGSIVARERIEIAKTGSVEGEVTTSRIAVEDGAIFRGSVNIAKPSESKAAPVAASRSEEAAKPPEGPAKQRVTAG